MRLARVFRFVGRKGKFAGERLLVRFFGFLCRGSDGLRFIGVRSAKVRFSRLEGAGFVCGSGVRDGESERGNGADKASLSDRKNRIGAQRRPCDEVRGGKGLRGDGGRGTENFKGRKHPRTRLRQVLFRNVHGRRIEDADSLLAGFGRLHGRGNDERERGNVGLVSAVTYTHSGKSPLSVPEDKSERFSLLREKLSKGDPVKAVYYGDSITYGWGSTALAEVDRAPRCPGYCDLAMDYLESKYGSEISRVNLSKSGETSAWAKEYANYKKVCDENPDLVILAFGMNDGVVTEGSAFVANIKNIVKNIRARCPDAEIAVVTSMLPNEKVGYQQGTCLRNYHAVYPGLLAEAEEKWEGVGVADVTAAHTEILARKKFQDTTSSNTNHPNDFMHRIYAQVLLRTLLGEEF